MRRSIDNWLRCAGRCWAAFSRAIAQTRASRSERSDRRFGLDPALFGQHPNGRAMDAADLCVQAPSVIEIRLPADLAAGCELATTGVLDKETGAEGSVQLAVVAGKPATETGLLRGETTVNAAKAGNGRTASKRSPTRRRSSSPKAARPQRRVQAAFDDVSATVSGRTVLHEDRAGRRSRHADAVLSRGRSPRAADAR